MPTTLIIGGNGVLGHFVTRRLVHAGERPIVMSRGADVSLLRDIAGCFEHARGDMTDAVWVRELVDARTVSHIVHLGAALPSLTETDPAEGVRLNVIGTINVLEAARLAGVRRVVMASSKSAYGPVTGEYAAPTYRPVPETARAAPDTIYGLSKLHAEQIGRWYQQTYGLSVIALRFCATIGPGKIARHGGAFSRYSVIVEHAMAGRPVEISHNGDEPCDAMYNDDAARGILCALHADAPARDVYNIATGTGFTLREFGAAVSRRFPDARISIGATARPSAAVNCVLDPSAARQDLDFTAHADVDQIVDAYLATMRLLDLTPG